MKESIAYILLTIILTLVEFLRIKISWGKVPNVSKKVSKALAFIAFVPLVILFKIYTYKVAFFVLICVSVRGVFYDPFLNIWLGRKVDNESFTTNSKGDGREIFLKLTFWKQRLVYLILFIINFCLYMFL